MAPLGAVCMGRRGMGGLPRGGIRSVVISSIILHKLHSPTNKILTTISNSPIKKMITSPANKYTTASPKINPISSAVCNMHNPSDKLKMEF